MEVDWRLKRLDYKAAAPDVSAWHRRKGANTKMGRLLNAVFPPHVAEALSEGRQVEPERREMVTIFFSDLVGFTTISAQMEPKKAASMLDRVYSASDALSRQHRMFKVGTIGDAYLAITNLVEDQAKDHAVRIANFAVAALEHTRTCLVNESDSSMGFVKIRVGIHSGPVVANVVGSRNPRYCLFRDTVNTASRMESTSEEGSIHMSRVAAQQLRKQDPSWRILSRGPIEVKGKGLMTTYWLSEDRRQHLHDARNPEWSVRSAEGERGVRGHGVDDDEDEWSQALASRSFNDTQQEPGPEPGRELECQSVALEVTIESEWGDGVPRTHSAS